MKIKPIYNGERLYVFGPAYRMEQFGFDGPHLSWKEWPDGRIEDPKINGHPVSEAVFNKHRRLANKRSVTDA